MNDEQALHVLSLLDCKGLARTARDISVERIKAWMTVPEEIQALQPPIWDDAYLEGFERARSECLKIIANHRKEQNW